MNHQPPQSFLERLNKTVRMRPRWYFWLRAAAIAIGAVCVAVTAMFATSNFLFLWRGRELATLSTLGGAGAKLFVTNFPYLTAFIAILGIATLLILIWKFARGYRWPLAVLVGISIVFAFAIGSWTSRASMHDALANRALKNRLPFVGKSFVPTVKSDRVFKGKVFMMNGRLYFESPEGRLQVLKPLPKKPLPVSVFIIGERRGDILDVDAIRFLK